jgi:hypothetical protein
MIYNDEIVEIMEIGEGKLTDIEVSGDHLFFANDILVKNSLGVAATSDFMSIYGVDEDALRYENELHYKIVKNRLGGRVGEVGKFFFDARSLKYYDESELNLWLEESSESGDERKLFTPRANEREEKRGRRR